MAGYHLNVTTLNEHLCWLVRWNSLCIHVMLVPTIVMQAHTKHAAGNYVNCTWTQPRCRYTQSVRNIQVDEADMQSLFEEKKPDWKGTFEPSQIPRGNAENIYMRDNHIMCRTNTPVHFLKVHRVCKLNTKHILSTYWTMHKHRTVLTLCIHIHNINVQACVSSIHTCTCT